MKLIMKKICKIIMLLIAIFLIVKVFIFLTKMITHKDEIEKTTEVKDQVSEAQAQAFIQAVEEYCSLELVKGRPIPDRITNPKEILTNGELPQTMDITLTEDCKATGIFRYGKTTYQYNYKTGKLTKK